MTDEETRLELPKGNEATLIVYLTDSASIE